MVKLDIGVISKEDGIVSEEELIEVLRQFDEKRVEELPEKTRNIFYAIMKIADERDELENIRKEAIRYIQNNQLYNFDYDKEELFEIVSDKVAKEYLLYILNKGDKNE